MNSLAINSPMPKPKFHTGDRVNVYYYGNGTVAGEVYWDGIRWYWVAFDTGTVKDIPEYKLNAEAA